MNTFALRGDFLCRVRDDPGKNFFECLDQFEPCSVEACAANFKFLLEITASLAAEPCVPAHATWKALSGHLSMSSVVMESWGLCNAYESQSFDIKFKIGVGESGMRPITMSLT